MKDLTDEQAKRANAQSEINASIGSLLERWYTRDTDGCRFCNAPIDDDGEFCDEECSDNLDLVVEARIAIGKRDMDQRGYD